MADEETTPDTGETPTRARVRWARFGVMTKTPDGAPFRRTYRRGEVIEAPAADVERGLESGALIPADAPWPPARGRGSAAATRGSRTLDAPADEATGRLDEARYRTLSADQAVAHVGQHPDDAELVLELETAVRGEGKERVTVTRAAETILEERERLAEEAAELEPDAEELD